MEDWQKNYISNSIAKLLKYTEVKPIDLAEKLCAKAIVSSEELEVLTDTKTSMDKCLELYRIMKTKTYGYEALLEVLDEKRQYKPVHILLKGILQRDQKVSGGNSELISANFPEINTLQGYVDLVTAKLVATYQMEIEKTLLEEPGETFWDDKHKNLHVWLKSCMITSLGNFNTLNLLDIAENLEMKTKEVLTKAKSTYNTLQILKENSLLKYIDAIKQDMDLDKTEEELQDNHTALVTKIVSNFLKTCEFQQQPILEKYSEKLKKLLDNQFLILKTTFDDKYNKFNRDTLDPAIEVYKMEMNKHLQRVGYLPDNELHAVHEKACSFILNYFLYGKTGDQKMKMQKILDEYMKLFQKRNEMSRSQVDPAIGIDLGTVNCCVSVYFNGKVRIISNDHGLNYTPSYVSFNENGNFQAVGEAAKKQAFRNPETTIYDAKRIIGRPFATVEASNDISLWPFTVVNQQQFPKYKINQQFLSPEDVSAALLSHCRDMAEKYLKCSVKKAVITVPAYFNEDQRSGTLRAAQQSALEVLSLINEPIAAGIAYGWDRFDDVPKHVIIFDLGGGTFDVAALKMDSKNINVLGYDGDTHLGGNDVTFRLVRHCIEEFKISTGIELAEKNHSNVAPKGLHALRNMQRLYDACETCKKNLSFLPTDHIYLSSIVDGIDLDICVTREKLEDLCEDLFRRMIKIVDDLLTKTKTNKTEIDDIILVGGSTRIPKVQLLLQTHFNKKVLDVSINPDEAVAYGAAVLAAIKNGEKFGGMLMKEIADVVPMSIGIECLLNGKSGRFWPIIKKNSRYPTYGEEVFYTSRDDQETGQIFVYQGDSKAASDNYFVGKFIFAGIPRGKLGTQKIRVCMKLNENGILELEVVCESTKLHGYTKFEIPRLPLDVVKTTLRGPQIE